MEWNGRRKTRRWPANTRTSTVAAAQPRTDISRASAALMLCWGQGDGEQLQACTKGIPVYSEVCEPGCEPESLPLSWLRGPLRLNGRSEFEGANGSERVMERGKIWTSSDGLFHSENDMYWSEGTQHPPPPSAPTTRTTTTQQQLSPFLSTSNWTGWFYKILNHLFLSASFAFL